MKNFLYSVYHRGRKGAVRILSGFYEKFYDIRLVSQAKWRREELSLRNFLGLERRCPVKDFQCSVYLCERKGEVRISSKFYEIGLCDKHRTQARFMGIPRTPEEKMRRRETERLREANWQAIQDRNVTEVASEPWAVNLTYEEILAERNRRAIEETLASHKEEWILEEGPNGEIVFKRRVQ